MAESEKTYKDLNVWQEARKLSKDIYSLTSEFPKEEQFGLINQMRRCAISVPSNIAEGCGRNYPKDSIQFFHISRGSLYELETQLYLIFDLNYIDHTKLNQVLLSTETTRKLLSGFIRYYQKLIK
uniref:four helix bundle protein n=1 Tax=Daejeonella sp. TaxID=2805397 RepID=UPI00404953C9